MVELKFEAQIEAMRAAGAVVAEALRAVVAYAAPGRTTRDLDAVAAGVLATHGAGSPFLGYHPRWATASVARCTRPPTCPTSAVPAGV